MNSLRPVDLSCSPANVQQSKLRSTSAFDALSAAALPSLACSANGSVFFGHHRAYINVDCAQINGTNEVWIRFECGWCLFNRAIDVPDRRGVLAWRKSSPGGNAFLIRLPDFQTCSVLVRRLGVMRIEVDFLPMAKPFSKELIEVPPWSGVLFSEGRCRPLVVFTQGHDLGPQRPGDCF